MVKIIVTINIMVSMFLAYENFNTKEKIKEIEKNIRIEKIKNEARCQYYTDTKLELFKGWVKFGKDFHKQNER